MEIKSQIVLAVQGEGGNVHEPQTPFRKEAPCCFSFLPFKVEHTPQIKKEVWRTKNNT